MTSKERGAWGEQAALQFYKSRGYQILAQNYFARFGELDLVVMRGDALRFVEVKARSDFHFGRPEEYVNRTKRRRLRLAARDYLARHEGLRRWTYFLFDIVEVDLKHQKIHWIPNAFSMQEEGRL